MQDQITQPDVLSFFPILYVAWADAILTPSEIQRIEKRIKSEKWLSPKEKEILPGWLYPKNPPSPATLKKWLSVILDNSISLSKGKRKSLADSGVDIASIGAKDDHLRCSTPKACKALSEIEEVLGVLGDEAKEWIVLRLLTSANIIWCNWLSPILRWSYSSNSKLNLIPYLKMM